MPEVYNMDAFVRIFSELVLISTGREMKAERLTDDLRQHCNIHLTNKPQINKKLLLEMRRHISESEVNNSTSQ